MRHHTAFSARALLLVAGAVLVAGPRLAMAAQEAAKIAPPELSERRRPLTEIAVERTVAVADFGAKPGDGENDLPAVRAALEAVRNDARPSRVVFAPGRYVFDSDFETDLITRATRASMVLFRQQNVVLDGAGAEIVIRNPRLGFVSVLACKNVIVKDFTVDWDPPPFAQGWIRRVDAGAGTFDFEEEPGYLSLEHPNWQIEQTLRIGPARWGVVLDPNVPGKLKADRLNVVFYRGWKKIGDRTFRIEVTQAGALAGMAPGDRYVQVDRNGGGLVHVTRSERVTCIGLTNYTSPGLDYGGSGSNEVAILDCRVLLKKGRWHTSNADGIHFAACRVGPWVEGCTFEGMTDDGVNFYTKGATCLEVLGPRRYRLVKIPGWRGGDRLLVFNPREGTLLGRTKIVKCEEDRTSMTVTTEAELPEIQTGREKTADSFFNLDMNTGSFVIRGNTFRNIRRYGLSIQSRDGIIENNHFQATSSNGIMVHNAADWPEGFATGNLVIRGNTFVGCGFDHTLRMHHAAAIGLSVDRLGGRPGKWRGLQRILIEDNTIVNWRRQGICLGCAEDAVIRNNRFLTRGNPPPPVEGRPLVPIRVFNIRRVLIEGNTIADSREIPPGGIVVEEPAEEVTLRDNHLGQAGAAPRKTPAGESFRR